MRETSDSCWLRTALPKYAHLIRDGALPYMIHAKAKIQHVRERERGKELALRRNDQTDGIRLLRREVAVCHKVLIYDRVDEVVVYRVIDV